MLEIRILSGLNDLSCEVLQFMRGWKLTCLPSNYWQVLRRFWPGQGVLNLFEFFQLHSQGSFRNFVPGEDAEMTSQAKHTTKGDKPLGWIVLVPMERVPVVHWELVMKIVVSFAHR